MVPAWIYNQALILQHAASGPVFIPLRFVSVMAILMEREWVFCDYIGGRVAVSVWHHFAPQSRDDLHEGVPCRMDLFSPAGEEILRRLPMEFHQALNHAIKKSAEKRHHPARIIALDTLLRRTEDPEPEP
nr:hypothetical protein [Acidithiobacillus ferrianus]